MKRSLLSTTLLATGFLFLTSCNNEKDKTTGGTTDETSKNDSVTPEQPMQKEEPANTAVNQVDYAYGPSVSVITGTVTTEMFYGPPGYGEHPETDKKEEAWLLILDKPINVIATANKTADEADEPTVNNISKIQLILPDDADESNLKNKKVKLTGTFFGKHTGHHRTDVLMEVQQVTAQ